ncbi:uncharacterized protein LOC133814755 [Humulus lupulus]|uniref:uncharacterized protein LOC133814755 n=1 Tax=Humulus lupulus TaxID=3486 RepID=UPI002B401781|nr:uncharacterized protein LOC133814755 [Humulus lupulus]
MGRGKLKLELIPDEKSRKTTFIKRKKGIMKKAYEFSVLCDVDICLLVSDMESGRVQTQTRRGLSSKNQEDHPHHLQDGTTILETYPPERHNVLRIIQKYQKALTQRASNKSYDLAGLLAERNKKVQTEISRCRKKYYAVKYPASTDLLEGFSANELAKLYGRLGVKIETVKKIIEDKKKKGKVPLKAMKNENVFRRYQTQQQLFPPIVKNPPRHEFDSSAFSLSNNSNSMMFKLLGGDINQSSSTTTSKKDYGISTTIYNNNNMHNGYGTTEFGPGRVYHHHQDYATAGAFLDNNYLMMQNNIGTKNTALKASTSNSDNIQYSTVTSILRGSGYNDPTVGMSPQEKYTMMMSSGSGSCTASSLDHHYYYPAPTLVQQPIMPYRQLPMNGSINNVDPRLGSFQVTSATRENDLIDAVNNFLSRT